AGADHPRETATARPDGPRRGRSPPGRGTVALLGLVRPPGLSAAGRVSPGARWPCGAAGSRPGADRAAAPRRQGLLPDPHTGGAGRWALRETPARFAGPNPSWPPFRYTGRRAVRAPAGAGADL